MTARPSATELLAAMAVEHHGDLKRILNVLEDARRDAVRRERESVRRRASDKQVVYDQGIADGLRQAIAIIEGGKW